MSRVSGIRGCCEIQVVVGDLVFQLFFIRSEAFVFLSSFFFILLLLFNGYYPTLLLYIMPVLNIGSKACHQQRGVRLDLTVLSQGVSLHESNLKCANSRQHCQHI